MKVLVMGTGGIGGYFGARLARAGEAVTFVARGAHLEAIRQRGLTVRSSREGEFTVRAPATDDPGTAGPADLVLFCVKSYDTESAARALSPAVGRETVVLSLQNGVDNEERIGAVLGADRVLGGAAYILATIEGPGVIAHAFGGRIAFGEMDGAPTPRARRVLEAFERAGIPAELSPRIRAVLWEKYLFINALAGMTALTRCPVGVVRTLPETRQMFRLLLEEVAALAKASGVELPPQAVEATMEATDALGAAFTSSLHHDLTHGKRLELEALQGHAVRLGERLGIPTPMLFAVYAALRPFRDGAPA
jgi:2-dehydropantoate 2-reductase